MKKSLALLLLLTLPCLGETRFEVRPIVAGGLRLGDQSLNDNPAFYLSAKFTTFKYYLTPNFLDVNFLSPSINFQDDERVSYGVSPISMTANNGLTAGMDFILKREGVDGGSVGIFIGYKF